MSVIRCPRCGNMTDVSPEQPYCKVCWLPYSFAPQQPQQVIQTRNVPCAEVEAAKQKRMLSGRRKAIIATMVVAMVVVLVWPTVNFASSLLASFDSTNSLKSDIAEAESGNDTAEAESENQESAFEVEFIDLKAECMVERKTGQATDSERAYVFIPTVRFINHTNEFISFDEAIIPEAYIDGKKLMVTAYSEFPYKLRSNHTSEFPYFNNFDNTIDPKSRVSVQFIICPIDVNILNGTLEIRCVERASKSHIIGSKEYDLKEVMSQLGF